MSVRYTPVRNDGSASSLNSMELEMTSLQNGRTSDPSTNGHNGIDVFAPRPRRSNTCDCSWKTTLLLLVLVPLGLAALIFVILLGAGIVTTDSLGITEPQDPHYDFVTCKEGYTRCDNGYECILDSDVCDGITEHCSDNSDERGCAGGCKLSEKHYYRCKNGDCIKKQWQCDREKDCDDGDDEIGCEKCNMQTEYTCANYDCVPLHTRCDGVYNCRDRSDEYGCFQRSGDTLRYLYNRSWTDVCHDDEVSQSASRICSLLGHGYKGAATSAIPRDYPSSLAVSLSSYPANYTTNGTFIVSTRHDCTQTTNLACSSCGQSTKQVWSAYLVGGDGGFPISDWPWHVKLTIGNHICGGSIISQNWILTAAHCLTNQTASAVKVVYSSNRFSGAGGVTSYGKRIILHPQFHPTIYQEYFTTYSYDVALVEIDTITYNDNAQPVCLPTQDDLVSNATNCYITGFGSIVQSLVDPKYPSELQEGKTRISSKQDCSRLYDEVYGLPVPDDWLCAGYITSGVDSCGGDSGGPLVCQMNGRWVLQGVVSWGSFCKQAVPSVYARVSDVTAWIDESIR